jgi:hypothetical protein
MLLSGVGAGPKRSWVIIAEVDNRSNSFFFFCPLDSSNTFCPDYKKGDPPDSRLLMDGTTTLGILDRLSGLE